jgi:hypothetical protein
MIRAPLIRANRRSSSKAAVSLSLSSVGTGNAPLTLNLTIAPNHGSRSSAILFFVLWLKTRKTFSDSLFINFAFFPVSNSYNTQIFKTAFIKYTLPQPLTIKPNHGARLSAIQFFFVCGWKCKKHFPILFLFIFAFYVPTFKSNNKKH